MLSGGVMQHRPPEWLTAVRGCKRLPPPYRGTGSALTGPSNTSNPDLHPMTLDSAPETGDLTYSFRPSLLGAPWTFVLTEHGLEWSAGRREGRVRYGDVRRVRMSFKPASMQYTRFITEVWAEGAPKLEMASSSWKSMVEQERLDRSYAAFVTELHARLARSDAPVRYDQGSHPLAYWPGLVLYVLVALALAAVFVRALEAHSIGAAAFIGGFVALFIWQGGSFFRRNRPSTYRTNALPRELMPRV